MTGRPTVVIDTSDHHSNGSTGLMPPQGVVNDDGLQILPSKAQRWTWEKWLDFHRKAAAFRKEWHARLVCILDGDMFDGAYHHGTTQTVTGDPEAQKYIIDEVFKPVLQLSPDEIHVVRGTISHVGQSEEALGKALDAVKDPDTGKYSSFHRRLLIHDKLIDIQHHGRSGARPWTKPNALNLLACQIFMEHALRGERHPDLALRAHVHKFGDSEHAYPTRVVITPSWQLKTSYAHMKATEELSDIGGVMMLIRPDKPVDVVPVLYPVALPTPLVTR